MNIELITLCFRLFGISSSFSQDFNCNLTGGNSRRHDSDSIIDMQNVVVHYISASFEFDSADLDPNYQQFLRLLFVVSFILSSQFKAFVWVHQFSSYNIAAIIHNIAAIIRLKIVLTSGFLEVTQDFLACKFELSATVGEVTCDLSFLTNC